MKNSVVATCCGFDPVENQLIAYNKRDIDAFLLNFTDDCITEDDLGRTILSGEMAMRKHYQSLFESSPRLKCVVTTRIRVGHYVIDEEKISGRSPGTHQELKRAVVIYHLDIFSGLIDRFRLITQFN